MCQLDSFDDGTTPAAQWLRVLELGHTSQLTGSFPVATLIGRGALCVFVCVLTIWQAQLIAKGTGWKRPSQASIIKCMIYSGTSAIEL